VGQLGLRSFSPLGVKATRGLASSTASGRRFALRVRDRRPSPALVDLDLVEGKTAQVAQRGEAGAEIVERNAHTEIAQLMQRRARRIAVLQQQR
jgi:hypothetical protein